MSITDKISFVLIFGALLSLVVSMVLTLLFQGNRSVADDDRMFETTMSDDGFKDSHAYKSPP